MRDEGISYEVMRMIYVMSDIHGRIDRFESILRQIDLQEQDHLYVLGDVIDRNVGGVALMFRLLQMPNATLLLGNHEWMMRDCIVDGGDAEAWIINGGMETLMEYFDLSANQMLFLWDYLRQLPIEARAEIAERYRLSAHTFHADFPVFAGKGREYDRYRICRLVARWSEYAPARRNDARVRAYTDGILSGR